MKNKIYAIGIAAFVLVWFTLVGFSWFGPRQDISLSERRKLAQAPELTLESILKKDVKDGNGNITERNSFMSKFERFTLDQFPLRDQFRQVKSVFQYYVMQQMDNNNIYVTDNYAAELLYPLKNAQVEMNTSIMDKIYETYLKPVGAKSYVAVVPDKGYYLAEQNGYLSVDYEEMFGNIQSGMSDKVTHIDITDVLSADSYFYTDTHWRQEKIVPVAEKLAEAMEVTVQPEDAYTRELVGNPFYGVYYGFAALPMNPEQMYLLHSDILDSCVVRNPATGEAIPMYDMTKANSNDLYDIFFSGNQPLVEIVNTKATGNKELVVFADSFGRSLVPLLTQGYRKITVVDLRLTSYLNLDRNLFVRRPDVLFLYSTISLNSAIAR